MNHPVKTRFVDSLQELRALEQGLDEDALDALVDRLLKAERIYVAGGGRSGLMARAIAMRLMHVGLDMYVVGETITPGIHEGDLLWIFSASGKGAGLAKQIEGAKAAGAGTVGFIANQTTPLADLLDLAVQIPAGYGGVESLQHAGSLFEQACLLVGDALASVVKQRLNVDEDTMNSRHFNLY
jgi:6-phospho-3-hexuloisomerase